MDLAFSNSLADLAARIRSERDLRRAAMKRRAAHIISGASHARRTVNLPLSIVKIRFWQPGQFVVAGSRRVSKNSVPYRGTEGSKPSPSSEESDAN